MTNALVIVEGEKFEIEVLGDLFIKLGYNVQVEKRRNKFIVQKYHKDENQIFLIPGPKSQVTAALRDFDLLTEDLPSYFGITIDIGLIYIVYDVDNAKNYKVTHFCDKYNTSQEGLLILSNPCFEVIADDLLKPHVGAPHDYKDTVINQLYNEKRITKKQHSHLTSYIQKNIFSLLKFHAYRNALKYGSLNVLDHLDECKKDILCNVITQESFYYENLFTTVYVMISEILGVTKEIENVETLINKLDELQETIK